LRGADDADAERGLGLALTEVAERCRFELGSPTASCPRSAPALACLEGRCVVASPAPAEGWRVHVLEDGWVTLYLREGSVLEARRGEEGQDWSFSHGSLRGGFELSRYAPTAGALAASCDGKVETVDAGLGGTESPLLECKTLDGGWQIARTVTSRSPRTFAPTRFAIWVRCAEAVCAEGREILRRAWVW
jgi:hypothetical protein